MTQLTALPLTGVKPSEQPVATSVGPDATIPVTEGGVTRQASVALVVANAPGGGATDHGALTGLSDDDHPQYYNQARGDARYSQLGHTHAVASGSVDGLMSSANFTKLAGVATSATANATDAQLRDRGTHTGTQLRATISDFDAGADARITAQKGAASGLATLDSLGKLAAAQIPDSLLGNLNYQGTWNATTNVRSPAGGGIPAAATGNKGHYYIVSVAGTTNIDGEADWGLFDWIVSNGSAWTKVDNSDSGSADAATIRGTSLTGLDSGTATLPTAADTILTAFGKLVGWAGTIPAQVRAVALTGFSTASAADVTASDTTLSAFGKLQAKWSALATSVLGVVLTGWSVGSNAAVVATDTITAAFGKLQGQINALVSSLAGKAPLTPTAENVPTGSAYTFVLADEGKVKRFVDASPQTGHITTAMNGKAFIARKIASAGTVTIDVNAGCNVNGLGDGVNLPAWTSNGSIYFQPTGTNTWDALGSVGDFTVADITDMPANARTFNQAANYAAMRAALGVATAAESKQETLCIAVSDETTALTTGVGKVTFRMPYALLSVTVRASVTTAPTGSALIVDINENGTTIMTTNKLSIDATEKTSTTAATAAGVTDASLADDAEITIDIDQVGSTVAGAGLKVYITGVRP